MQRFFLCLILTPVFFLNSSLASTLNPSVNNSHHQLGQFYGGDFTLTDHNNKPFSLKDARGKVVLIHFGFTSCADICPTTLVKMGRAINALGDLSKLVQPLFISVDAQRDTPDLLREYTTYFHPSFLGLTGTQQQVEKVAAQYRTAVRVRKPDNNGYYVVDHSSRLFLVDIHGQLASVLFYESTSRDIKEKIELLLDSSVR